MGRLAGRRKWAIACLCVLLALGVSMASADDPNGPVLTGASISELEIDESTGQRMLGFTIIRAPGVLSLAIDSADRDLLGIRIKERYVLPNGVESSFEESYPVFAHRVLRGDFMGYLYGNRKVPIAVPVHFRTGNHIKDEQRWRDFLECVKQGETSQETDTPPVYVTMPDPNAVEVSVSVYDNQGHESRKVPVSPPKQSGRPGALSIKDKIALKSYKDKGVGFARWPEGGGRSGPDNAALLYLRAAVGYEAPDPCTGRLMDLIARGREPDDRVLAYLGHSLTTIGLLQLASQVPDCDFGPTFDSRQDIWGIASSLRKLSFLMAAHGQSLAAGGHCRAGLENCFVNRHLARHIGDDSVMDYLVARTIDVAAIRPIRQILQDAPPKAETLRWLRDEIANTEGAPWRPAVLAQWCLDQSLSDLERCEGERPFERSWALARIRKDIQKGKENNPSFSYSAFGQETEPEDFMPLSDEQLYVCMLRRQMLYADSNYGLAVSDDLMARARRTYDTFVGSVIETMAGDAPYAQKQARLGELHDESLKLQMSHEPVALLEFPDFARIYELRVRDVALLNLVKVAIEVHLIAAETGDAPASLPEGLPRDPYTGQDFGYARIDGGFVLQLDPNDVSGLRTKEYEFKTPRP